jgi:hypothetical protein
MTYGVSEARLAELLSGFEDSLPGDIRLAYLPSSGINKLRLTATGSDRQVLNEKVEDIDFDINEWYRLKYENDRIDPIKQAPEIFGDEIVGMSDEEYVAYMIEQRKNHYGE